MDGFVNRVLAGPIGLGHSLVNDGHERPGGLIEFVELAALAQGGAHRPEVVRADAVELDLERRIVPHCRVVRQSDLLGITISRQAQWSPQSESDILDAWQGLDLLNRLKIGRFCAGVVTEESEQQRASGYPDIRGASVGKTRGEHSGPNEQDEAHADL